MSGSSKDHGRVILYGICLILILSFESSCSKEKSHTQPSALPAPNIQPSGSELPSVIFPHPEGWGKAASHGPIATANRDACLKCHKVSSDHEEIAPPCQSCHNFPHPDNWVSKTVHGRWVREHGKESCGTLCHGPDFAGGLSHVACTQCHSIYPHGTNWANPTAHGDAARRSGNSACVACHGNDLLGGSSNISCTECHALYPHGEGWEQDHRNYVTQNGREGCATECHGRDLEGGASGVSCNRCHALYPHSGTIVQDHGDIAQTLGLTVCRGCHGDDYRRVQQGQTCYTCHADFPHILPGWLTTHGGEVRTNGLTSCAPCHGNDGMRVVNGQTCASCHPAYPLHQLGVDGNAWERALGHGNYVMGTLLGNTVTCQLCHGSDLAGGISGVSCMSAGCHDRISHSDTWGEASGHGREFSPRFTSTDTTAPCFTCHGSTLFFTEALTRPALEAASECYRCHLAYPHKGFQIGAGIWDWEPVVTNTCGARSVENFAHLLYLMDSPLFTDARGNHPELGVTPNRSPLWQDAIDHTCGGGTAGSCHKDGNRTYRTRSSEALCGTYCHGPTRPLPPALPACPPVPEPDCSSDEVCCPTEPCCIDYGADYCQEP